MPKYLAAMLAVVLGASVYAHPDDDGIAYTSEVVLGFGVGSTVSHYHGVVAVKVSGAHSVTNGVRRRRYVDDNEIVDVILGRTYDATLRCPSPVAPKEGGTFEAQGIETSMETTFAFAIPHSEEAGHLSSTWTCGLHIEIWDIEGVQVQDEILTVRIVYVRRDARHLTEEPPL